MKTLLTVLLVTLFLVTTGCETNARLSKEPGISTQIGNVKCGVVIDGKLNLCEEQ